MKSSQTRNHFTEKAADDDETAASTRGMSFAPKQLNLRETEINKASKLSPSNSENLSYNLCSVNNDDLIRSNVFPLLLDKADSESDVEHQLTAASKSLAVVIQLRVQNRLMMNESLDKEELTMLNKQKGIRGHFSTAKSEVALSGGRVEEGDAIDIEIALRDVEVEEEEIGFVNIHL